MKQIINKRFGNETILDKYYIDDKGQKNGLRLLYWYTGNLWRKQNFINDKQYGLQYCYSGGKINNYKYFL